MNKKFDLLKLFYRIIIVLITGFALFLNIKLFTFKLAMLYFTILSNFMVLIYFIYLIILSLLHKKENKLFYYTVKGMITMCVTLTMFVYYFIIFGNNAGLYATHMLECNLVHLVVPFLVIFDYILFGEKGNLKKLYPIYWTSILFIYQFLITLYMLFGGLFGNGDKYPYFYMDVSKFGLLGVLLNNIIILIVYVLYGELVVLIDNNIKKLFKGK